MATVPQPGSMPETPPMDPGTGGDDFGLPGGDVDVPDPGGPGDPGEVPGVPETEAHPS